MSRGGTDWKRVYDTVRGIVMMRLLELNARRLLVDNPNGKLTHHRLDKMKYDHQVRQVRRKEARKKAA